MKAYHFLREDMTAASGDEPPWAVGETRSIEGGLALCKRGYHSSPSWADALEYAPGPVACVVEVSEPEAVDDLFPRKQVSRTRTLLAARDTSRELRLFACDCAERALARERAAGGEPDARSWAAVAVARRYAAGEATDEELAAARIAAWAAAGAAARDAARDAAAAAGDAAAAAGDAAWDAAWDAERDWQRQRLAALLDPVLAAGTDVQGEDA